MISRYAQWLHTRWPAGGVERLPIVGVEGTTNVAGVRIVGDLTGIPLLKLAIDGAVRAVRGVAREIEREPSTEGTVDLAILGGGVAGIAAAIEARRLGLSFEVIEAARAFDTVHGFPARKPIFTYPSELEPEGAMRASAEVREALIDELEMQRLEHEIEPRIGRAERVAREGRSLVVRLEGGESVLARRVLIAIGRTGDARRLGVPGEDLDHVRTRLFDPRDHAGARVLVVGGGDSACESGIALAEAGAKATIVHRGRDLARAKPENAARVQQLATEGRLELVLGATVRAIDPHAVRIALEDDERVVPAEVVLIQIGRDAPLAFLRRSGIAIRNEWSAPRILAMLAFLALSTFVYLWKKGGSLTHLFEARGWFPFGLADAVAGPLAITIAEPGFWYSLAYSGAIAGFGVARIRRRRTPYITRQTITLTLVQIVPLFVLPYVVLPLAGHAGLFDAGPLRAIADALFPVVEYGHGREYWRAFGLILAWPLFVWNVFTEQPSGAWLAISFVQTFVLLPWIVRRWGKGAYCGWICSCGALAETMGDAHREKMPHGPGWNRLNMLGQALLGVAGVMLLARIAGWIWPHAWWGRTAMRFARASLSNASILGVPIDWSHSVDLVMAGILGVGLYFWMSGRTWCRFACPLAALMNIYQRAFGLFRIFADKKRCISCNRCTTVCHQGIDVMAFAQRGAPMEDPQCVRCSACVHVCPTGVLSFGRIGKDGVSILDTVPASPVLMREQGKTRDGKTRLRVL